MADCNAGSYTSGSSMVYYDPASNTWREYISPDTYIPTDSGNAWLDAGTGEAWSHPAPGPEVEPVRYQKLTRKEKTMIDRQTFLDALTDEGKSVGSEGREIVKEAKSDKWELFIARLLARVFESGDLAMLKEKPKEVLIKEA